MQEDSVDQCGMFFDQNVRDFATETYELVKSRYQQQEDDNLSLEQKKEVYKQLVKTSLEENIFKKLGQSFIKEGSRLNKKLGEVALALKSGISAKDLSLQGGKSSDGISKECIHAGDLSYDKESLLREWGAFFELSLSCNILYDDNDWLPSLLQNDEATITEGTVWIENLLNRAMYATNNHFINIAVQCF